MPPGRSLRSRASLTASSKPYPQTMSRTRRTASSNTNSSPAITVARVPSPETNKKSIRLTVKMPSNKLREATSGGVRESITVNPRDTFDPSLIVSGPRGTRAKRTVVIESGSEDDEDEDEEEEAEDEDVEEDEEDDGADEDEAGSDEDAEGEDDDADADGTSEEIEVDTGGDTPMEDAAPPPPIIRMRGPASKPRVTVTVTPATDGKVKSVEAKETQPNNSDDDEDLSELESAAEGDEGEEDAEGEEIGDEAQDMDQDDEDADSDADTPAAGSRASTPDVSKMTKRQRSRLDQVMGSDFLQLPMGTSPGDSTILPPPPPLSLTSPTPPRRTPDQKTPHRGRTRDAPRRNGAPAQKPLREAQRGGKNGHHQPAAQETSPETAREDIRCGDRGAGRGGEQRRE